MNLEFALPLAPETTSLIARTLFDILWLGLLWGLIARAALFALDLRTPQSRYALQVGLLVLLSITPVVTFLAHIDSPTTMTPVAEFALRRATVDSNGHEPGPNELSDPPGDRTHLPAETIDWHRGETILIVAWLAGTVFMAARLVAAGLGLWSLLRRRVSVPADVALVVERLARRMKFVKTPAVSMIDGLGQAMAVGVFRPLILLPAAWIAELPPDVMEAVIAHELAHLRRWDLAINLVQRLVETVLFFHPVVWWCSRRLRVEREQCCDELAQAALGNRLTYAKALSYLAHQRRYGADTLLAAGIGGSNMALLERIRRVLGLVAKPRGRLYGPGCVLIGAVAASIFWAWAFGVQVNIPWLGLGEHIPMAKISIKGQPSERAKVILPNYTIEPPDILSIEAIRVIPKPPYHLQSGDELALIVEPDDPSTMRSGKGFVIDPEGRIDLGPRLGKVKVVGLTVDEATQVVLDKLKEELRGPELSLTVVQSAGLQPITGEHLVQPDGMVRLGVYGSVLVAGKTLDEARAAIEKQLGEYLDHPQVSLNVRAYNSKVYYVIYRDRSQGDQVARLPITGSETVLDALSNINGLTNLSKRTIFIARPSPGSKRADVILPVDWNAITEGASTETNYQVMPGDRIFVSDNSKLPANRFPRGALSGGSISDTRPVQSVVQTPVEWTPARPEPIRSTDFSLSLKTSGIEIKPWDVLTVVIQDPSIDKPIVAGQFRPDANGNLWLKGKPRRVVGLTESQAAEAVAQWLIPDLSFASYVWDGNGRVALEGLFYERQLRREAKQARPKVSVLRSGVSAAPRSDATPSSVVVPDTRAANVSTKNWRYDTFPIR